MSETTIQVPAEHLESIRQSLIGRRGEAGCAEEIESLLGQIAGDPADEIRLRSLTGPRAILWSAVYDSLCAAAERLADDCNDYWRGSVEPAAARAGVAAVGARLELLVALGAPPGG
jgi:hypothetical protein